MIIAEDKKKRVISSHDFDSVECTIDAEDMRYVASLLRNNYSNPQLAVVREITANALDANIEAKAKRKVEISIPSRFSPNFCVRDFGSGLSQEDVFGLYSKYGKSTKRNSNSYIGAFGIGKFAPLSYGNNFTCVSFHGGKKTSYNVFVDENDDTKIVKLDEEPSSEPTGLSIEVAIADSDINNFKDICKSFFKFFTDDEMPIFRGIGEDEQFLTEWKTVMESKDSTWQIISDNEDYWARTHHEAHAFMGRVHYPINTGSIDFNELCKSEDDDTQSDAGYLRELCQQDNLYIRFDIGELKLHHSRESLEYNKQTQLAIIDKLRQIKADIEEIAKEKLDSATCLWDAKCKYAQVMNALPHTLQGLFRNSFEWEGIKITSPSFDRDYKLTDDILITEYTKLTDGDATDGYRVKSSKQRRVLCHDKSILAVQDGGSSYGNALKARTLFNENEDVTEVYVVYASTEDGEEHLWTDTDGMRFDLISPDNINLLSKVEKAKLKAGTRHSGESRADVPVFGFITDEKRHRYRNTDYWENALGLDDLESLGDDVPLVYVPIANYKIVNENGKSQESIMDLKDLKIQYFKMRNIDKKNFPIVYGIRRKDCANLDKSVWMNWEDFRIHFAQTHLVKHRKKLKAGEKKVAFKEHEHEMKNYRAIESVLNNRGSVTLLKLLKDSLGKDHDFIIASTICREGTANDEVVTTLYNLLQFLREKSPEWVKKNFPDTYNWKEYDYLCKDIQDRYPLLVNISKEIYQWQNMQEGNFGKNIGEYISMCDEGVKV